MELFRQLANNTLSAIDAIKNQKENDTSDESESTNKFTSAIVLNLGVAVVGVILFSFLRPRLKRIYSPRQLLLDMMFPLGKLPHSFFAWIIPAFMANDDDVFYYAGMDALVYMRFLKLCFKISLVIMPYGIAVLVPLNYYGKAKLHGLDRVALSNIEHPPKMWAPLVGAWFYTIIICYLLYEEWRIYIMYRQEHLTRGRGHQYAILVRDLPAKLQDEQSMKGYVEEIFPDQIEDVVIVEELSQWQKLVEKHDSLVWKLEHAKAVYESTGDRPMHRRCLNLCGSKYDSISQYERDLTSLQNFLEDEISQEHRVLPCAVVIFRSLRMASVAVQVGWDNSPLTINVLPAPEVTSVIWKNLANKLWQRKVRTTLIYAVVFLLVFFWTIPVAFVSSLITLPKLAKVAPFLTPVFDFSPFVRGIIEGVLSSVALWIFFAVLPMILQVLTRLEGIACQSEVDRSVLGKLFIFVIINQFLFLTAGSTILYKLKDMIRTPETIPTFLAESLPAQSTFFICFIILRSFTGFTLELLRIVDLVVIPIRRKWFCKTPREDEAAWRPPPISYDRVYADHLLVLIVGLSFSVLAPLITPFVAVYFGFGYVVWMHQVLCVYIPEYSGGGLMWPKVFNRIIAGMIVFHLLMIGVLTLKASYVTSAMMAPLPILTVLFFLFIQQHYLRPSSQLSLTMALGLTEAAPNFLQEVAKSYVRNHQVPSTYGLSTVSLNGDFIHEYDEISADFEPSVSFGRTPLISEPV